MRAVRDALPQLHVQQIEIPADGGPAEDPAAPHVVAAKRVVHLGRGARSKHLVERRAVAPAADDQLRGHGRAGDRLSIGKRDEAVVAQRHLTKRI